jgi:flagellar basal body-associated protein FliL
MMSQDPSSTIAPLISTASVVALVLAARLNRGKKRILIPDYRRGVLFVDGTFVKVLEPGSYRVAASKQQVTIVDMRPQPILLERVFFQDALKNQGVISVAVDLLVQDPHLSATMTRDQVKDGVAILRDQLRTVLSQQIADLRPEAPAKLADAIAAAANNELRKIGMRITATEVTEFWSAPMPTSTFSAPATVQ